MLIVDCTWTDIGKLFLSIATGMDNAGKPILILFLLPPKFAGSVNKSLLFSSNAVNFSSTEFGDWACVGNKITSTSLNIVLKADSTWPFNL